MWLLSCASGVVSIFVEREVIVNECGRLIRMDERGGTSMKYHRFRDNRISSSSCPDQDGQSLHDKKLVSATALRSIQAQDLLKDDTNKFSPFQL